MADLLIQRISSRSILPVERDSKGGIWHRALAKPTLPVATVHVWRASLDDAGESLCVLAQFLSPDEQLRASRFRFQQDRDRFVAGRGILRVILGGYVAAPPDRLTISYGPRGKPFLAGREMGSLRFNLSHSQGLALYAFALGRNVGVDVEALRPVPDADQIVERILSPSERAEFRSLPGHQKQRAFFHCWTQKEAFIKAVGDGLSLALDRFDVSVSPDEAARLLRVDGDPESAGHWMMQSLNPAPGFLGALACDGSHRVVLWEWNRSDL